MRAGTLLQFIGGGISRVALSALIIGGVFLAAGATPWQLVANFFQDPPAWMLSPWFTPGLALVGLALIAASLWFNLWSKKQQAIDDLAEDISFAIQDLVNRKPRPKADVEINKWKEDYDAWCARVSKKLENRAFFTLADQLHFDRLGFIQPVYMSGDRTLDDHLSQLRLKFERLREVINWSQQRRR